MIESRNAVGQYDTTLQLKAQVWIHVQKKKVVNGGTNEWKLDKNFQREGCFHIIVSSRKKNNTFHQLSGLHFCIFHKKFNFDSLRDPLESEEERV